MNHLEELVATPSAMALYFMGRYAGRRVKVVLTGQGADEPLGGYHRYIGEKWHRLLGFMSSTPFRQIIAALPRNERLKRAAASLGERDTVSRFTKSYALFEEPLRRRLLKAESKPPSADVARPVRELVEHAGGLDSLAQMMYVDTRLSLPDDLLLYGDKMSMAHSLEARVPYLDLELLRLLESMPSHMRVHGLWSGKYVHRLAARKWLPERILSRRKKGFDTPMDRWLRGGAAADRGRELLLEAGSGCRRYFNEEVLEKLLDEHRRGREDRRRQLFALMSFEEWYRQFLLG